MVSVKKHPCAIANVIRGTLGESNMTNMTPPVAPISQQTSKVTFILLWVIITLYFKGSRLAASLSSVKIVMIRRNVIYVPSPSIWSLAAVFTSIFSTLISSAAATMTIAEIRNSVRLKCVKMMFWLVLVSLIWCKRYIPSGWSGKAIDRITIRATLRAKYAMTDVPSDHQITIKIWIRFFLFIF